MTAYPEYPERFSLGGLNNQVVGPTLDSTDVSDIQAVTHLIHPISGAGELLTLTPPWPTFAGIVILLPAGACTFTNTGNIAVAITCAANCALVLAYNPVTNKWWPAQGITAA